MEKLTLNAWDITLSVAVKTNTYLENGNLYIGLLYFDDDFDEYMPWSVLTVNLGLSCQPDCAFVDTNNNGTEILEWIVTNKLGKPTGRKAMSGFCIYPEVKFDLDELNKYRLP